MNTKDNRLASGDSDISHINNIKTADKSTVARLMFLFEVRLKCDITNMEISEHKYRKFAQVSRH